MSSYLSSLLAMEHLLNKAGEDHWRDWVRRDISEWKNAQSVTHHLSAYGGMGSLNDIYLCTTNNHQISHEAESWIYPLFECIKTACYFLAHNPSIEFQSGIFKDEIEGEKTVQLQGWRCLECGHGEVDKSDVNNYVANLYLPSFMIEACVNGDLIAFIDEVLNGSVENRVSDRAEIIESIRNSKIGIIRKHGGWMRPCPSCGSEDTAVYRWERENNKFSASSDNLPVKKKWWKLK